MQKVIIHCAATPNGRAHTAQEIHHWHKDRGWDGIGYHYVIRLDGIVERGRPEYWQGSHTRGENFESIGICLIGTDAFTVDQWASLKKLVSKLMSRYPGVKIHGHNEFSSKDCPGFNVTEWVQNHFPVGNTIEVSRR